MCDCLTIINEELSQYNTQVSPALSLREDGLHLVGVYIETHKLNESKRGKPKSLIAAYCPFCGAKYNVDQKTK